MRSYGRQQFQFAKQLVVGVIASNETSEEHLLSRIRTQDHDAFAVITERFGPRLLRTAFRIMKNAEDAEDVLQEALARAYTRIGTFKGDSALGTWLTSIVVNCALMEFRRRNRRREVSLDQPSETGTAFSETVPDTRSGAEENALAGEMYSALKLEISRLAPKLRATIETHLRLDCSMAKLAEIEGTTVPAVKSRLLRAKLKLTSSGSIGAQSTRNPLHSIAS